MRPPVYCLRAFRHHPIALHSVARWQPSRHANNASRRCTRTHASNATNSASQPTPSRGAIPLLTAAAAALTTGTALFVAQAQAATAEAAPPPQPSGLVTLETLQGNENVVHVLSKQRLLAEEVPLLDADHMFSAFVRAGIVRDIDCYYDKETRTFYSVIAVGRQACGWPATVHGGLIASIVDESFGGLMMCLIRNGVISGWRPSYTVQLDVTYKQRMPHNRTIICASSLQEARDRKTWFTAAVSDAQTGSTYATAKALFVAPRLRKVLGDVVSAVKSRAMFWRKEDE